MTSDDEFETPQGWTQSTLGGAVALVKDKIDPTLLPDDTPYVGLEHVEAHTMKLLGHGRASDVKSTKTRFRTGDVLYGKLRPYLNKVARPNFDGVCSTDFLVFSESPALDRGYLAHYLNQLWVADRAHHLSNGVELPRVDWKSLRQFPITYPVSKDYQQAIVHGIEHAIDLRVNTESHLEAAQRGIKRFRQAILASACSGRLTATWRETRGLDQVRPEALLERVTEERRRLLGRKFRHFEPDPPPSHFSETPAAWIRTSIGNIATLITKGSSPAWQGYEYLDSGVLFVRSQNVRWGYVNLKDVTYVSPDFNATHAASIVHENDVLLNLVGASVGRAATAPRDLAGANLNQAVAIIRPATGVCSAFLTFYLLSPFGQQHIHSQKADVARANFNLDDIKVTPIPLPSMAEQEEIARVVRKLFVLADEAQKRVDSAYKLTAASSQAVLARAFRGELMPAGTELEAAEAKY